jgi:type VI secretion system secreted protein Hcp
MAVDTFIWFDATGAAGMKQPKGETTDDFFSKTTPNPAFELKDWSFGVTNKSSIGSATGGAGSGKAEFNEFTITKSVDSASPLFFQNCVAGAHYKTVTLACRKAGVGPAVSGGPYLVYQFATVFTTKVEWKHSDEGPTEEITFVYGAFNINYKAQKADGTMASSTPVVGSWSVLTNKADTGITAYGFQ